MLRHFRWPHAAISSQNAPLCVASNPCSGNRCSAGLVLNLVFGFLPMATSRTLEVLEGQTRLVEVAPGYEVWCQDDGGSVRNSALLDRSQVGGKFQDEEDEDWNLEDGNVELDEAD